MFYKNTLLFTCYLRKNLILLYILIFVKFLLFMHFPSPVQKFEANKIVHITQIVLFIICNLFTIYTSLWWHLTTCEKALRCELFCIYAPPHLGSLSSKIAYQLALTHLAKGSLLPDLLVHP